MSTISFLMDRLQRISLVTPMDHGTQKSKVVRVSVLDTAEIFIFSDLGIRWKGRYTHMIPSRLIQRLIFLRLITDLLRKDRSSLFVI